MTTTTLGSHFLIRLPPAPPHLVLCFFIYPATTETEQLIEDALSKLLVGRTTLIIAHRLSTVRRADRLVVMNRGRVVEDGSHAELLALGGLYARLYQRQFRDENIAVEIT